VRNEGNRQSGPEKIIFKTKQKREGGRRSETDDDELQDGGRQKFFRDWGPLRKLEVVKANKTPRGKKKGIRG